MNYNDCQNKNVSNLSSWTAVSPNKATVRLNNSNILAYFTLNMYF